MSNRRANVKSIDVEGLPEAVVNALHTVVRALHRQFCERETHREKVELRTWPGNVIGRLNREEIYEDVR